MKTEAGKALSNMVVDPESVKESKGAAKSPTNKVQSKQQQSTSKAPVAKVGSRGVIRIPYVNRLKQAILKLLLVLPIYFLGIILYMWKQGIVNETIAWTSGIVICVQLAAILLLKFTNSEDVWEEYKGER